MGSRLVRRRIALVVFCCAVGLPGAGHAQAQERFRVSVNLGQQSTATTVSQRQTFERYFEQGSFSLERRVPASLVFDLGGMVRVWRKLHVGAAVSVFDGGGSGRVTARVPHPLHFNRPRTANGTVDVRRREVGQHYSAGWILRPTRDIDVIVSGGPSVFMAEQGLVTGLMLTLDKEVFPFDDLAFPGVQTETPREAVAGFNLGADMTWRLQRRVGVGLLVRYTRGIRDFMPSGGSAVEVTVGGLHVGGGLRLTF